MVLGLYGASGLGFEYEMIAREVNDASQKWEEIIFIDDNPELDGKTFSERTVMSFSNMKSKYKPDEIEIIISMGEPEIKDILFKKIRENGYKLTQLVHPSSSIGYGVEMGEGVVIQSFNRIPPYAKIGNNVLIQGSTCMGHGINIGDNAVISSFVFIGGGTQVGNNTYVAPHSCLRNMINVGSNTIIGMGSVVTKDIPDNVVVYGNPAKVVRENTSGRVFSKH